jgi:hypothetical protein
MATKGEDLELLTPAGVLARIRTYVVPRLRGLDEADQAAALLQAEDVLGNALMLVRYALNEDEDVGRLIDC